MAKERNKETTETREEELAGQIEDWKEMQQSVLSQAEKLSDKLSKVQELFNVDAYKNSEGEIDTAAFRKSVLDNIQDKIPNIDDLDKLKEMGFDAEQIKILQKLKERK